MIDLALDAILPSQLAPGRAASPYLRLIRALLQTAIDDLITCRPLRQHFRARRIYQETHDWLHSDAEHWGAFIFCCGALGIDPAACRRALLQRLDSLDTAPMTVGAGRYRTLPVILQSHADRPPRRAYRTGAEVDDMAARVRALRRQGQDYYTISRALGLKYDYARYLYVRPVKGGSHA